MKSAALYLATVLIWGSTWLAIEFQLGDVAVEVSLFYRFAIAAILMWAFVLVKKLPMQYSLRDHGFFALLALFNFGLNYLVLYWANCETNLLWCSARRNGYCKLVLATNSAIRLE